MADRDIETLRRELAAELGEDSVHWDDETLSGRKHDTWPLSLIRAHRGTLATRPACVVTPADTAAVQAVLRAADRAGIAVAPFGAGSGVCGGFLPSDGSIVVDMRRMNRLLDVDETSLTARVEAGMMGNHFEAALNERGYSMGHFPQSIELSTVGGWVSTRAAGQFSTRYGSIEDMLLGLEVVLAGGDLVAIKPSPRRSAGPDLRHLFLGSEGTLGVITEITVRIFPLPESRRMRSFAFTDFESGLEAIRLMMRAGWRPPVLRLYDAHETARHFGQWAEGDACFLLVVSEGAPALANAEIEACREICLSMHATETGEAPVEHWMGARNHVPSLADLVARGFVVDTIEVTADWARIGDLYREVIAAVGGVESLLLVSGHSSHSYAQGTNIYFTFVAQPKDPADAEAKYLECWSRAMDATVRAGGSISHHHGIGRLRVPWMRDEHGAGIEVMRAVKRALDPKGILNPGALLPPVEND